jgi:hypothetical protein
MVCHGAGRVTSPVGPAAQEACTTMPAQPYPYQAKRRVKARRSAYPVRITAWIIAGVALGLVLCCGGLFLGAWLQDFTEPFTKINQPRPKICSVDDCERATKESPGPPAPTRLRSTPRAR